MEEGCVAPDGEVWRQGTHTSGARPPEMSQVLETPVRKPFHYKN